MNETLEISKILDREKNLYNQFLEEKKNGKVFNKSDITESVLYELSVNEGVIDTELADLFNLSRNQVIYLRKKYNLENVYLRRMVDNFDEIIKYIKESFPLYSNYSQDQLLKIYIMCLRWYCKDKKYNIGTLEKYLNLKNIKIDNSDLNDLELDYEVTYTRKKHVKNKKRETKHIVGHKINQSESNKNKIDSGKFGEKIVYKSEIKRLEKSGLTELSKQVKWISKTDREDITFDGTGYDIISYNEFGEKIYIEVKCSLTNNTDNVYFNISDKEVKFMNGELEGIDKNHCFIYYVYNVNSVSLTAEIFIIDSEMFSEYKLIPTNYKISESFEKCS